MGEHSPQERVELCGCVRVQLLFLNELSVGPLDKFVNDIAFVAQMPHYKPKVFNAPDTLVKMLRTRDGGALLYFKDENRVMLAVKVQLMLCRCCNKNTIRIRLHRPEKYLLQGTACASLRCSPVAPMRKPVRCVTRRTTRSMTKAALTAIEIS